MEKQYSCSGVYLWTEEGPTVDTIAYIGKAGGSPTLFYRHLQHYMGYLGGTYTIPKEFRNSSEDWMLDIKKDEVQSTIFNLEKFKAVVEEGFLYAKKLSIYLAPAPTEKVADIERNLLYQVKPTRTNWGTNSKPGNEMIIRHTGALSDKDIKNQRNR
jgi:hypothetical protein